MPALKVGSALSNPEDEVADTARQNVRFGAAHLTGSATSIGARNGGYFCAARGPAAVAERDRIAGPLSSLSNISRCSGALAVDVRCAGYPDLCPMGPVLTRASRARSV